MTDSRQFVPELTAILERLDDGREALLAPSPGLWRDRPELGALIRPGDEIGALEILDVLHRLRAPEGAVGVVTQELAGERARAPVDYGARLLILDAEALGGGLADAGATAAAASSSDGALVFCSPSSGRFYQRPAPDKANFVEIGQIIERGQTIGLLEVMKTFTRINYDDPKLPARARIAAIVAADQAELGRGDTILQLERVDD